MAHVDLNADCGESFGPWAMGDDPAILSIVTSANVACGFHAGDPDTMVETFTTAKARGVSVGAHPGYQDLTGFGRRIIPMKPDAIERMVAYQIGAAVALSAVAGHPISHVKAHGALSNHAMVDAEAANAVAAAVKAVDPSLTLLAIATTELERAGREAGLTVAAEIFADRAYEPNGLLMSRAKPGSVLSDGDDAAKRIVAMVQEGAIIAHDGTRVPTAIDSICVHGDNPHAIAIASTVRKSLEAAGITLTPFATNGG